MGADHGLEQGKAAAHRRGTLLVEELAAHPLP